MTKYRPEIDGLRTIAVFSVIIFHLNSSLLPGGYYGVDIFLVISGYLITSHIYKQLNDNQFSFKQFWLRRIKRLLPTLLFVIISTLLTAYFILFKPNIFSIANDAIPSVLSYFNIHAYLNFGNYWGKKADSSFFLHTWSLSLEEQFYLFYPIFLFFTYKFFKTIYYPIIFLIIVSLILFSFNYSNDSAFYLLPFRIWELSLGGLIALSSSKSNSNKNDILVTLGLLLILFTLYFADKKINFHVLTIIISTCVVIKYIRTNSVIYNVLSSSIFTHFGKLSYSLYLWHWPVILFFDNFSFKFQDVNLYVKYILILFITYILSLFTYYIIENKTRNNSKTPIYVICSILILFSISLYFQSNLYDKTYINKYNNQEYFLNYFDVSPKQNILDVEDPLHINYSIPSRLKENNFAYKNGGIKSIKSDTLDNIILFGDSHGVMWSKLFETISNKINYNVIFYTTNGSKPFVNLDKIDEQISNEYFTIDQRIDFAKSIKSSLNLDKTKMIFISCRWDNMSEGDFKLFEEFLIHVNTNYKAFVYILNQPPLFNLIADQNSLQYVNYLKIQPNNGYQYLNLNQEKIILSNSKLNSLKEKYNVTIVDVFSKYYNHKNGIVISNIKDFYYFDDDHLNYSGTKHVENYITNMIINNNLNVF